MIRQRLLVLKETQIDSHLRDWHLSSLFNSFWLQLLRCESCWSHTHDEDQWETVKIPLKLFFISQLFTKTVLMLQLQNTTWCWWWPMQVLTKLTIARLKWSLKLGNQWRSGLALTFRLEGRGFESCSWCFLGRFVTLAQIPVAGTWR